MTEDLEVVFKERLFVIVNSGDGQPLHVRGVVIGSHGGQGRVAKIEVVHVRDGATALAAVGVVEDVDGLQAGSELVCGYGGVGFFGEFAQAGLPDGFARFDESAGQGEQAFSGRVGAADEQDLVLAAQQCVDGDEDGRIRRAGPRGAVACQHAPFFLQGQVFGPPGELCEQGSGGGGQHGFERLERRLHGFWCGTEVGVADHRGVDVALALHGDEPPGGEGAQVAAGGILEVTDQADVGVGRRMFRHRLQHRLYPARFVVVIANGEHGGSFAVGFWNRTQQHGCTLFPREWVFGRARLEGRPHDDDDLPGLRQCVLQQGQVAGVHGLKAADQDGGVEHGDGANGVAVGVGKSDVARGNGHLPAGAECP